VFHSFLHQDLFGSLDRQNLATKKTWDVYELIGEGSEDKALEIIRKMIPAAAESLDLRLSSEATQMTAAIILERARKVQKLGEWNKAA